MVLFPPIARIYGSRNKDVDMRMAPFIIISSNSLEKKIASCSHHYALALEILVSKEGKLLINDLLNWKLKLPPGRVGLLVPLHQHTGSYSAGWSD